MKTFSSDLFLILAIIGTLGVTVLKADDSSGSASGSLKTMTPVQLLNVLKGFEQPEYFINEPLKNWITKKDLPVLLSLVDSKEPCSSVALLYSSYYSTQKSTVGQQALFMLEGYRKGEYPPALNLVTFSGDKNELLKWAHDQVRR